MRYLIVIGAAATMLGVGIAATPADARTGSIHRVAWTSVKQLRAICSGHGTFVNKAKGYACTYKNGNVRECSKMRKDCVTVVPGDPVIRVRPVSKGNSAPTDGGILDSDPSIATQRPAPTGKVKGSGVIR